MVELSLQPAFGGRHYSGLVKAIGHLPLPQGRPFQLLAVDTVPHPRPYTACLEDRGFIYVPNPVPGQKLVAVGHLYSLTAFLSKGETETAPPWAVFLDARRVATDQNAVQVAREQVSQWLQAQAQADPPLPADQTLAEANSRYSTPEFIYPMVVTEKTHVLVQLRSNRVVFCPPGGNLCSGGILAGTGSGLPWATRPPGQSRMWRRPGRHRPAGAHPGLPPAGVAGDANARDSGMADVPVSFHPHPGLGHHAGGEEDLSPVALAVPVRPPAERMVATDGSEGIFTAPPPRARPPLAEAESPGDSVSDAGGGARGAVVAYPVAGRFPVVAGPEDEPARAPVVGAACLPAARRPAGRRDPLSRPGSAGVWANHWAIGSPALRLQPREKPRGREKGKRRRARLRNEIVRKGASEDCQAAFRPN